MTVRVCVGELGVVSVREEEHTADRARAAQAQTPAEAKRRRTS